MDWTATVINIQDNLPSSDIIAVSVDFTNGTDDLQNTYQLHAAEYSDLDTFNTFLSTELARVVAVKDVVNSIIGAANASPSLATATAAVAETQLASLGDVGQALQESAAALG